MSISSLALIFLLALGSTAQDSPDSTTAATRPAPSSGQTNGTEELPDVQERLLAMASEAVRRMPDLPHLKTKSRLQEQVALQALDLGKLAIAEAEVEAIGNWRRSLGYAYLALGAANSGQEQRAQELLALAGEGEILEGQDQAQGWRRERILATMALTYVVLGDQAQASQVSADVAPAESRRLDLRRTKGLSLEECSKYLIEVRAIAKVGEFEQLRTSLLACVSLYGEHFAQVEMREQLAAAVRDAWHVMPVAFRVELLLGMALAAKEHGDVKAGSSLLAEVDEILGAHEWSQPQLFLPLLAEVAAARFAMGDGPRALQLVAQGQAAFQADVGRVANIYHARAMRPLAEVLVKMGETKRALAVFETVLDLGQANPNSRPRAEDFVATCCALADSGLVPSDALWSKLEKIKAGLGAPW